MACVHAPLYTSPDLARIDLGSYVKNLMEQLSQTSVWSGVVGLDVEAHEIRLTPDAAIPCGRILTKLVSNGLK